MSAPAAIPWWEAEPRRLEKDRQEIGEAFPDLVLRLDGQGYWTGRLPTWTFQRPAPEGLGRLVPTGVRIVLAYTSAYPIVSPYIFPTEPEPLPLELTQTRWHILGNGALCLFQTQADWDPSSSVVDLLMRAVGWRIEYALLKAGACEEMTMASIVNDPVRDSLIAETGSVVRHSAKVDLPGKGVLD